MRAPYAALQQRARRLARGLPAALLGLTGGLIWAALPTSRGRAIACALSCVALVLVWCVRRADPPPDPVLAACNAALTRANARLAALAATDALTALPNQRALGDILEREVDRARRYGRGLAVLVLDLDHFKALNDGHGHAAGDAALRDLAVVARAALRDIDVLGRWGGEEFVAIVPESAGVNAVALAERVRLAVASRVWGTGGGVHLTCSIGVAVYPHDATDGVGLIEQADHAMYTAKRAGRNRVCLAGDPAVAALAAPTQGSASRAETALAGTVEALAALLEVRDPESGAHGRAVDALARRVALALGLDAAEARMVGYAGRLHDLGKMGVPDAVLRKSERLDADEWALLRRQPVVGADVVSRVPALRTLAQVIGASLERWDGRGYPQGLAGVAIPLGARIVAVADAYVAMTTVRPYQPVRGHAEALEELRRCAGSQFDPRVVGALERVGEQDAACGWDDRAS